MPKKLKKKTVEKCRFNMDVTPVDYRAMKKAAADKDMSMSAWARGVLRKASGR